MDSEDSLFLAIILQLLLILVNAAFSMAEISLLTVNRNKLESLSNQGNKKAAHLLLLLREPAKFLATIQVGNTLTGFLGSAFAAGNFSGYLTAFLVKTGIGLPYSALNTISVVSIILLLAYFSIVLSELVPKRVAMKKAETFAFIFSGPLRIVSGIFAPAVFLLTGSTNAMLCVFGINPKTTDNVVTEEEIRLMIDLGSAGGTIKSNEKEFLHNVFEFDNKTAGEAMTHRTDAVFLNLDDIENWEKAIAASRHSNYPVCGDGPDDIRGILNVRDFLLRKDRSRESVMRIMRPARFIPLSARTDILFTRMKKSRNHFAVVVDEYGSVMGIITMSDLLEELVGDLEDDITVPEERPLIETAETGAWFIGGMAPLDAVSREIGVGLPVDRYDTFSGFVFSILGRIPEDGSTEELEVTPASDSVTGGSDEKIQTIKITILEVKDHRLERALVRIKQDDINGN